MPEDRDHEPERISLDYKISPYGQRVATGQVVLDPGDTLRVLLLDDGTELQIVRTGGEPERRGIDPHTIIDAIAADIRRGSGEPTPWPFVALCVFFLLLFLLAVVFGR